VKSVIVIQARTGSVRMPGKVLLPLSGGPLLACMIERVRAARTPAEICVATTDRPEDAPIREIGQRLGVPVIDGHSTDLLDRHYQVGKALDADVIVKIPSDCPLIDPGAIERVLGAYFERPDELDFVTNLRPPSWPDGNDVEVMPMRVLELAWREATSAFDREHTTPFIWRQPERFRIVNVVLDGVTDFSHTHRLTIDYPEDYELVRAVYRELWRPDRPVFRLPEILDYLDRHREVRLLNSSFHGKTYATPNGVSARPQTHGTSEPP
jgi:spore coat polysaccharide biosynthesis protein SpsF